MNQYFIKCGNMMDWKLVKKMTFWNYEKLIKKISEVFSYSFVQEHYGHNMSNATDYVRKLLGYDVKYTKHISRMTIMFNSLNGLGVESYTDLICRVENKRNVRIVLERRNYRLRT
jgi:hypothetical protein